MTGLHSLKPLKFHVLNYNIDPRTRVHVAFYGSMLVGGIHVRVGFHVGCSPTIF